MRCCGGFKVNLGKSEGKDSVLIMNLLKKLERSKYKMSNISLVDRLREAVVEKHESSVKLQRVRRW